jgi:hypothetical protein
VRLLGSFESDRVPVSEHGELSLVNRATVNAQLSLEHVDVCGVRRR